MPGSQPPPTRVTSLGYLLLGRVLRSDSRVTAMATPRSSTISPMIWAPNSELPRDSGMRDESATAPAVLLGTAAVVPGAGVGDDEGLICGKRFEALPAGIVVDSPATAGSAPSAMELMFSVLPDRPGMSTLAPADGSLVAAPEPEPGAAAFGAFLVADADGELAAFTVIVGAVAVAVSVAVPSVTVTVAVYLTVSPAVAVFGTVIWGSTWGCGGLAVGTVRLQVVPLVLVQLATVNVGAVNAGVVLLGVSVEVILPAAVAVTPRSAAGLAVAVPVALGVGVGAAVAEPVGLGEAVALVVLLAAGEGEGLAATEGEVFDTAADGEAAADGELAEAAAEGDVVALVAETLAVPEAEEVAVAGGELAAMAVPVTPLVMTKRPVARPTVTGLECADRIRTPCLSWLSRRENVLSRMLCHSGVSRRLLVEDAPIRHQNGHPMPPLRHTSPQFVSAPSPSVTAARAAGPVVTRPNSPTVSVPRTVPVYARLSKRKPACARLNHPVTSGHDLDIYAFVPVQAG